MVDVERVVAIVSLCFALFFATLWISERRTVNASIKVAAESLRTTGLCVTEYRDAAETMSAAIQRLDGGQWGTP